MSQQSERGSSRQEPAGDQPPEKRRRGGAGFGTWMASTAIQTLVAVVGLVVVLFALGQAVGADILGTLAGALSTHTGMWLAVAFIALIVLGAALRAMSATRARW